MSRNTRTTRAVALAALTLMAGGCAKKEAPKPAEAPAQPAPPPPPAPLAVAGVTLGKSVDSAKMVGTPVTAFGVKDTIYASVGTTGVGSNASVGAKWSYVKKDGSLTPVNETSQTITTTGPAAIEFHIAKATPWPKGKYRIEVQLNGAPAGSADFDVQ
ncbi:MAG TPA: hypothetical protein VEI47_07055 [Gemmatimonadales bacterium]|jgi:hypothetical protein|nr:hypothetical protein [Gemmatimonadales bacterium]